MSVNYGIETLTLRLDPDRISVGAVEQQIRALGYAPHVLDGRLASKTGEDPNASECGSGVTDVHSASTDTALDGTTYNEW